MYDPFFNYFHKEIKKTQIRALSIDRTRDKE